MRLLFAITAVVATFTLWAAPPVEDDVVARTLDTESEFYYPALMARYVAGDETLTGEDYHYLYYGYAYTPEYDAHAELPGESVMYDVLRSSGPRPSKEEAEALIEAGRRNMAVDPFNPANVNMMTWAYGIIGDTVAMRASGARFRGIIGAIESSGTGLRENSPWHILRFSHANDVVAERGLKIANRQVRSRTVEYIQVEPNPQRVKGFFFNYDRIYWKPYQGERITKDSNWEINGIPL